MRTRYLPPQLEIPIGPSSREQNLIRVMRAIVAETMDYPPVSPASSDSYLPPELIARAQNALGFYHLDISPTAAAVPA